MQQQGSNAHELLDLGKGMLVLVVAAAFRRSLGQACKVVQRLFGFFRQGRVGTGGEPEVVRQGQGSLTPLGL